MKNSIVLKSLELAGFQNPTAITKIISYVPNPQVALEMLLGVHEPVQIEHSKRFKKYKYGNNEKFFEILEIDELGGTVLYNVFEQNTKTVFYVTEEDYNNKVNYHLEKQRDVRYYTTSSILTAGHTKRQSSMKLEEFESSYNIELSEEDAIMKLSEWSRYGEVATLAELV
jgi:hypothetical protein